MLTPYVQSCMLAQIYTHHSQEAHEPSKIYPSETRREVEEHHGSQILHADWSQNELSLLGGLHELNW